MPTTKAIIRKKGRYKEKGENRSRYVIEWFVDGKKHSQVLPKPEKLLQLLDTSKKLNLYKENEDTF